MKKREKLIKIRHKPKTKNYWFVMSLLTLVVGLCLGMIISSEITGNSILRELFDNNAINNPVNQPPQISGEKLDCYDTDAGINTQQEGICHDQTGSYIDHCLKDYKAKEYYCSNNRCNSKEIICNCYDGSCINVK